MEWLEFQSWSVEVTKQLDALNARMIDASEAQAKKVVPFRAPQTPRLDPRQWQALIRDWPRDGLWASWT